MHFFTSFFIHRSLILSRDIFARILGPVSEVHFLSFGMIVKFYLFYVSLRD